MTLDFLSSISSGSVMTLDSHRTVCIFRSWIDLLWVVLAFWISILKSSNHYFKTINTGLQISQASRKKHLESSSELSFIVLQYPLSIYLLYTYHCHMLLLNQVMFLVKLCFIRVKNVPLYFR